MKQIAIAAAGLVSLTGPVFADTETAVEIRMIANMGVLISHDEDKVLVDALFTDVYDGRFRVPSVEDRTAMIEGAGDFAGADVLLFTHLHGDHFNADEVLAVEADIPVIGTTQVAEALVARTGVQDLSEGGLTRVGERIELEARPMYHMPDMQNATYRISLGGLNILHLGDTNPDEADLNAWSDTEFDVVLYPIWWAQSEAGQAQLDGAWGEARRIALHIPAHVTREQAVAFLGEGNVLVDPGERITINLGIDD